jgi:threonine dehydrogenase-like Zn-dependent dehydrogenase
LWHRPALLPGLVSVAEGLLSGHEIGGVIDAVGDSVALAAGLPVAAEPLVSCCVCYYCRSGDYNRCAKRMLLGVQGRGGCAELVTVPATCVYPLPRAWHLRPGPWPSRSLFAFAASGGAASSLASVSRSSAPERSA